MLRALVLSNLYRKILGASVRRMSKNPGDSIPAIQKLGASKSPSNISDTEWKSVLSPEEYEVTRNAGTEPRNGHFDRFFENGRYICLCCGSELFSSKSKYWSGCGWPAFTESIDNDLNIIRIADNSHGMERVEVRCKQCNAHLGHVFDDGPADKGGERYCINSVSMKFEPDESAKQ